LAALAVASGIFAPSHAALAAIGIVQQVNIDPNGQNFSLAFPSNYTAGHWLAVI